MMLRRAWSYGFVALTVVCAVAVAPAGASAAQPFVFVQQGPGLGGAGASVALSADGNTALIGQAPGDNHGIPPGDNGGLWVARVFTRSGTTWTLQRELEGSGNASGLSVALSADGNTALIGSPGARAVWVFVRSGSTWTQQGNKLTVSDKPGSDGFGFSVALSADGNTAVIGDPGDNPASNSVGVGAAWVFTRSGSTWTQQGNKLTGSGEIGGGRFGFSVALSSDGNTALIGGTQDNEESNTGFAAGAAWVFTRSGSTWTQQGGKLTGGGETGGGFFGSSVALSSDGNTALIGGSADDRNVGAAWVFTRSGSTWTQQGNKLTASDEASTADFGNSVALSSDGSTALIGGPTDGGDLGAAWVFRRSSSTWTQQGNKLTSGWNPKSNTVPGLFGFSVALSSDANTLLIGEPADPRASAVADLARVFVPGHALSVAKTGTGTGTVMSAPKGLRCSPTCSALYAVGTYVKLTAKPAAGSVFSGWSGRSCSGKRTCTVTLSSDRSVIAKFTLKPPKITKAKIDRMRRTATFKFNAPSARMVQCALIKPLGKKRPKAHFNRCRSPRAYKHLPKGTYIFEVRALSHGTGPAAKRRFSI